jgi:hypothetical protein
LSGLSAATRIRLTGDESDETVGGEMRDFNLNIVYSGLFVDQLRLFISFGVPGKRNLYGK